MEVLYRFWTSFVLKFAGLTFRLILSVIEGFAQGYSGTPFDSGSTPSILSVLVVSAVEPVEVLRISLLTIAQAVRGSEEPSGSRRGKLLVPSQIFKKISHKGRPFLKSGIDPKNLEHLWESLIYQYKTLRSLNIGITA
ncbi:hypothetical protein C4577_00345 [Candidatus Parcubacteria bacterium]|nr:MAG: hypothetical protein C4577_00345 [Candidatus Parcubacteria bacterium]